MFQEMVMSTSYITHRKETRGIGGIFFDDYDERNPQEILKMVEDCLMLVILLDYRQEKKRYAIYKGRTTMVLLGR